MRTSIDQLHEGQTAAVRLSALNRRTTPVLNGKVFYVSADSIEENAGLQVKDVYIVRVQIPDEEIAKVHNFHPVPGMPADVLIQTSGTHLLRVSGQTGIGQHVPCVQGKIESQGGRE